MKRFLWLFSCCVPGMGLFAGFWIEAHSRPGQFFGLNACPASINGVVLDKLTSAYRGSRDLTRVEETRKWVNTLSDRCVKASYFYWLDVYERQAKQAIAEAAVETRVPAPPETK